MAADLKNREVFMPFMRLAMCAVLVPGMMLFFDVISAEAKDMKIQGGSSVSKGGGLQRGSNLGRTRAGGPGPRARSNSGQGFARSHNQSGYYQSGPGYQYGGVGQNSNWQHHQLRLGVEQMYQGLETYQGQSIIHRRSQGGW